SRTEEVKGHFTAIKEAFDQDCRRLAKQQPDHQRYLHEIEAALLVPVVAEPADRMAMLRESRRLSAKFNDAFNPGKRGKAAPGEDVVAGKALTATQRQGRMALAVTGLGERLLKEEDAADYRKVVNNLTAARWRADAAE